MKIYIAVDMEGVSGVNSPEHVKTDGRLYAEGRRLLTREVNAAVAGAFDAGADEVIVADMHGGVTTCLPRMWIRARFCSSARRTRRDSPFWTERWTAWRCWAITPWRARGWRTLSTR